MIASQRSLNKALDNAFERVNGSHLNFPLTPDTDKKYVIFSDHHKGAKTGADDFQQCEETYLAALQYYLDNDYTLIILGDAEELWEEDIDNVFQSYSHVLEEEARFFPDNYLRVFGNHDIEWRKKNQVKKHLSRFFTNISVHEGLMFDFEDEDGLQGQLFLVHGHQGTLDSDVFAHISAPLVRIFWATYQKLFRGGRTRPAENACLRGKHDTQMYQWTTDKDNLILIAGHTHRPVWSSRTHLEKLLDERYQLLQIPLDERPDDFQDHLDQLNQKIRERVKKYPPCEDTIKPRPSYFNTGCASFSDGDITGIELEHDTMRLIRWDPDRTRCVLEEDRLSNIFSLMDVLNVTENEAVPA